MRHPYFVFRGGGVVAIAVPGISADGSEAKRGERERISGSAIAFRRGVSLGKGRSAVGIAVAVV